VALPLSVIPTFAVMYLFGFTLNIITLLALSVVVGILVDDAIVEIENIVRHLRMGKSPMQAAIDAADEIGTAVIATSLTLAGGVRAGRLHARHRRQVLPRVRLDRRHRGDVLAAGGAPADADDGAYQLKAHPEKLGDTG
jgi:ribosomal protein S30